ncbi:MAG: hypothetical protein IIY49_11810 [Eubacterium sp.]|nr:hypothetical protein [Eubacterium sp.]
MAKEKIAEDLEVLEALKNIDFVENLYKDQLKGLKLKIEKKKEKMYTSIIIAVIITVITIIMAAESIKCIRVPNSDTQKIYDSILIVFSVGIILVDLAFVYKAIRNIFDFMYQEGNLNIFKTKQGEYTSIYMERFHGENQLVKLKDLKSKVAEFRTTEYVYKAEAYKYEEVRHEDFHQAVDSYKILILFIELVSILLIAFMCSFIHF